MHDKTDVVVVGAGPSGSFSALAAAKMGANVIVCEEHKEIGLPSHCAGHISIRGLERLGVRLPDNVVENQIAGVIFYSPSGLEFRVKLASPVTYVVNRAAFDRHLAHLAEEAGAEFLIGARVDSLSLKEGCVRGVSFRNGDILNSKMVIDAEGIASALLKQIDLRTFDTSLVVNAVNGEVAIVDDVGNELVEVYLDQKYGSGLFAWIIPRRDGSAKVGLATKSGNPRECLERFLKDNPVAHRKLRHSTIKNLSYHLIPLGGPIPKTYHDGFLAVGDVASQVKPTTGGGVIMGLTCAKIAGQIAAQAVQQNDFSESFLSRYQRSWRRAIGFDMTVMRQIRLMLNHLSDDELNKIIGMSSMLHLDERLQNIDEIDFQGKSLSAILKIPGIWVTVFYTFLASIM